MPGIADSAKPQSHIADGQPHRDARASSRLIAVAVVAALWWLGLVSLAVFTANPAVLNRVQIEQADFILEAVVIDRESGTVEVVREWRSPMRYDRLAIAGLNETKAETGAAYLIPVSRQADGFAVTRGRLTAPRVEPELRTPAYIYSANPAVVEQLEQLLGELH